jgi:uncharacterized repeat protein (TIGR03843 family)
VSENERSPTARRLSILAAGQIEVVGRLPWSSNGTFLVNCALDEEVLPAVYKPARGERPLWDFPDGLHRREVAAYELSTALGWGLVPETIERIDAPFGPGSVQRFVPADFSQHYFTLIENPSTHTQLRTICAFDVVANNADRKSGHCLLDEDGTVWAIDNGLCFHPEPKLRTVIWEFASDPLPDGLADDLRRLAAEPPLSLTEFLSEDEVQAVCRRAQRLASARRLPRPDQRRHHYPWPLV